MDEPLPVNRVNVLGVGISAINLEMALDVMGGWIRREERRYICLATVHGIMACQDQPAVHRAFDEAGLAAPDGMPLVWLGRRSGYPQTGRVYGPDLMLAACAASPDTGWRHYFYGGPSGAAERLAANLAARFPGLAVAGCHSPPYGPAAGEPDPETVARINAATPDIVWVGLGSPKQDLWMAAHCGALTAGVLVGVGAAFDYHAGLKRQAPRWMQQSGLEWLFRLANEPRRLWRRYLLENPRFILGVAMQALGLREYPPM